MHLDWVFFMLCRKTKPKRLQNNQLWLLIFSVIEHRIRQNVIRTLVTHLTEPCAPHFFPYHILTWTVIYYRTDILYYKIYLFND